MLSKLRVILTNVLRALIKQVKHGNYTLEITNLKL